MGRQLFFRFADVLILLVVGTMLATATVSRAYENARPSGAWTGHPEESSGTAGSSPRAAVSGAEEDKGAQPDVARMRSDLQKMKALINQMQVNLGFVQNAETPLKHQFELEIEMWQMLLNEMERRLENIGGKAAENPH